MKNRYPADLCHDFYLIQIGIGIAQVLKPNEEIPNSYDDFAALLLNKFELDVNISSYSADELRDLVFDALVNCANHMDIELHLSKSHIKQRRQSHSAFDAANAVME